MPKPQVNKMSNSHSVDTVSTLDSIVRRAIYYSTQMIHQANNRSDVEKGDPKVGGHPAACASSAQILGALHLLVREPQDSIAVKPHASPMDHAYSHLLQLFYHPDGKLFSTDESKKIMSNLRKFMDPKDPSHDPAFQSYHAVWDPDSFNYLPSGSVGIPPVVSAYQALAYRFAKHHKFEIPENAHFWSIIGDSEFREGSLAECMPDVAERGLGSVTWIVDYNRQNLDGTRFVNEEGIEGTDADRIERMGKANGWKVIQVRHGRKRDELFKQCGELQRIFEKLSDFELQALLFKADGKILRQRLIELDAKLKQKLSKFTDEFLLECFLDLGGNDIIRMSEALKSCRGSDKPTLVVAHTIKGWGIKGLAAATGNHSMLADDNVVDEMRISEGIAENDHFEKFRENTKEYAFCEKRGEYLRKGIEAQRLLKERNLSKLKESLSSHKGFPQQFGINLKLSPWANTQWMWGQLAAKMIRIANASTSKELEAKLTVEEAQWAMAARHVVTMAPDVGTSTNLNPSMDGKIYGPDTMEDFEEKYHIKDPRRPDLLPLEKESNRHLRFEIEEANSMSCLGAFGKMRDLVGIPFLPLMTVYDFFIKRALDQYFYNVYWKSSFILVGTPSGVTLSPEGAQHSWKSDLQIPNGITWEPTFAIEMDWILADAVRRHFEFDNMDREGVLVRAVTRGIEQKIMIERLRQQVRFQGQTDETILEQTRHDVLNGGYWLINYENTEGYAPGDNVVHIFAMGALGIEAVKASDQLLEQGIFANVALITSPDLLLGTLGRENNYEHLRKNLGVNANLYISSQKKIAFNAFRENQKTTIENPVELMSVHGSRVPIVAVCDGEPGLVDNIGSIIGVPQDTLAVRKHSKSGRPSDVYKYHHMDPDSIMHACYQVLEQAASEEILISHSVLSELQNLK